MTEIWESAQNALLAGDDITLDRLLREHAQLFREQRPPGYGSGGLAPDYSGGNAREIIVRNHHFESWVQFEEFTKAPVAHFEAAADAVVAGDVSTLERLLREHPDLVRARSMRKHHSSLLHYAGSNGVEDFRQKTPKNIVTIAEMLLKAGAEVDAAADLYGGGYTTLGLAATSIHPLEAGVLEPLIELLVKNGASVDGAASGSIVNACLANGRLRGAEVLASYGARLDLEGAAGLGRLELAENLVDGGATQAKINKALEWACQYGQTRVADVLLRKGAEIGMGLHWAAYGAHAGIVKLLLERNAPLNAEDKTWNGTPLGWALHAWGNPPGGAAPGQYYEVVKVLIDAGAEVRPEWLAQENVLADPVMLAALKGQAKDPRGS